MVAQLRPEKSTGYTPHILAGSDTESVPAKSTQAPLEASPVLNNAPTVGASLSSTGEVSASQILALMIILADWPALKAVAPESRVASKDGKIYFAASISGHTLDLVDGILVIDGKPASLDGAK